MRPSHKQVASRITSVRPSDRPSVHHIRICSSRTEGRRQFNLFNLQCNFMSRWRSLG